MTLLSDKEELLVQTLRSLPDDRAESIFRWATALAQIAKGKEIDWSDEWTNEDLRDASVASSRHLVDSDIDRP